MENLRARHELREQDEGGQGKGGPGRERRLPEIATAMANFKKAAEEVRPPQDSKPRTKGSIPPESGSSPLDTAQHPGQSFLGLDAKGRKVQNMIDASDNKAEFAKAWEAGRDEIRFLFYFEDFIKAITVTDTGGRIWSVDESCIPALVKSRGDGTIKFKTRTGASREVPSREVFALLKRKS